MADNWLEAQDQRVDTSTSTYQDWWNVFEDPALSSLIDTAYQQNLSLQVAGLRVMEARAQLGIATGIEISAVTERQWWLCLQSQQYQCAAAFQFAG